MKAKDIKKIMRIFVRNYPKGYVIRFGKPNLTYHGKKSPTWGGRERRKESKQKMNVSKISTPVFRKWINVKENLPKKFGIMHKYLKEGGY